MFTLPAFSVTLARFCRDLLIPPVCPICSGLTRDGGVCGQCWSGLQLVTSASCQQCALPFEFSGGSCICGGCIAEPPHFDAAATALRYNDTAKGLILALKYGDRLDIAPTLAHMMLPGCRHLLEDADFILPLPLHQRRFFRRRYNQSAELARHLIAGAGIPSARLATDILYRRRHTPSQGRLTKEQRIRNMQGAFAVPTPVKASIKGKSILIVDDVLTTGASLSAAAKCLKRAGAETVAVSVVARVC